MTRLQLIDKIEIRKKELEIVKHLLGCTKLHIKEAQ